MEKRRNCSSGAISPIFHNIFNMSLSSGVKLNIHLWNVVVRVISASALQICYVEVRILKYFRESLGLQDNESWLYFVLCRFHIIPTIFPCLQGWGRFWGDCHSVTVVWSLSKDMGTGHLEHFVLSFYTGKITYANSSLFFCTHTNPFWESSKIFPV